MCNNKQQMLVLRSRECKIRTKKLTKTQIYVTIKFMNKKRRTYVNQIQELNSLSDIPPLLL